MKKKPLLVILVILLFAGASYVLGWSSILTVREIKITGTNAYLVQYVSKGERLARVESRSIEALYKEIDFIKDVQVSRNWLTGTVSIAITERTPIAIYNNMYIDAEGKSFPKVAAQDKHLPTIYAPEAQKAVTAVALYNELPTEVTDHLTKLTVTSDENYLLEINAGNRTMHVRWGTSIENTLKAKVYLALMQRPENSKITVVDLTAPHAPIVK